MIMLFPTVLTCNTMGVSDPLQKLSRMVERYESDGGEIRHVEAQTSDLDPEAGLSATIDIPVSLCPEESSGVAASPEAASITDDGGLQVEFTPSMLPNLDKYATEEISTVEKGARVVEGGTVVMTITLAFGTEMEQQSSEESTPRATNSRALGTLGITENESVGGDTATADDCDTTTGVAEADGSNSISEQTDAPAEDTKSTGDRTDEASALDGVRDEDVPLYKDEECLRYLYDSFRTFDEMTQNIEMSISSETVRRYMIEAGIHEPSTYKTADETTAADDGPTTEDVGDADDGADEQTVVGERTEDAQPSPSTESVQEGRVGESSPDESLSDIQLIADGIGLPDGLTIEELANAIESSMTVFDVQRKLDLGQERTEKLLKQLNLIDLVVCRLSHDPDQRVTQDEIVDRIRGSTISN